jgi:hypothetical protein
MSFDEAVVWARRLVAQSQYLRRLGEIWRLGDAEAQYGALNTFIEQYRATGTRIEMIPQEEAGRYGLGPSNWARWIEDEHRIVVHEHVWTRPGVNPVEQVAHEVGATELGRIYGIRKAAIPPVTNAPPGIGHLTHVVDLMLRPGGS